MARAGFLGGREGGECTVYTVTGNQPECPKGLRHRMEEGEDACDPSKFLSNCPKSRAFLPPP